MTMVVETAEENSAPKLLKKRQSHSRWFAFGLIPLLAIMAPSVKYSPGAYLVMQWLSAVLVAVCILGRAYCSAYIGGVKNEQVMREGPFSIVRNPLYVFSFIGLAGVGLSSGMFTLLAALLIVFAIYYKSVVGREEAFLTNKFGAPYVDYTREVPRWIPDFSQWQEPEEITARPKFMRRTMQDGLLFFLPLLLMQALYLLHVYDVLPSVIVLP